MAKSAFTVLVLMSLVVGSLCYVYIIPGELGKSKDQEGFCFYQDSEALIKKGEKIITKNCEEVSCGTDYSIQVLGCGTFAIHDPNCSKFERDLSKPYPECCNKYICVEYTKEGVNLIDGQNTLDD